MIMQNSSKLIARSTATTGCGGAVAPSMDGHEPAKEPFALVDVTSSRIPSMSTVRPAPRMAVLMSFRDATLSALAIAAKRTCRCESTPRGASVR
jgi:hypothetical protein